MTTISRFFDHREESYFLLGPRGTGKSTWLRGEYPDAFLVDLLDPAQSRLYAARPELLEERVRALADGSRVVIDEIQKVPSLLDVVHLLMEARRGHRFVLTGSSARKLKREGTDMLAGRAAMRTMHPFMAAELGDRFCLDTALEQGLLPVVCDSPRPRTALDAYIELYIREEVQQEAFVRNVGSFARFLEAVSFSHSQPLNVAAVSRECGVPRNTVQGWLQILEDLLLGFRLPVFSRRARRAVVAAPKLYLFDTGVYRSVRPSGPLDRPSEIAGPALEGLVAQHLRAWISYRDERTGLYYWRTAAGTEVDFVLYGPDTFTAIEVKHTATPRRNDLRALRTFHSDFPECTPLLLHRGEHPSLIEGIRCVPCADFLRRLHPARAISDAAGPR